MENKNPYEPTANHISQQFDQDLLDLRNDVLVMGGLVEKQVAESVVALIEGDIEKAEEVRSLEDDVDEMELKVDSECTNLIALRQPAAGDLRFVMAVAKVVSDLERIGDEASKIAKMALVLSEEGKAPRGYVEVRHLTNHVLRMVNSVLDAFARSDIDSAFKVIKEDKSVDHEYKTAMRSLVTVMMEDPRSISQILSVMWVLRALERIGDHAANIAEQIIYTVKGKDVRHLSIDNTKKIVDGN